MFHKVQVSTVSHMVSSKGTQQIKMVGMEENVEINETRTEGNKERTHKWKQEWGCLNET